MRFNSDDIWHDISAINIQAIDIVDFHIPDNDEIFRISLEDFIYCWKWKEKDKDSKKMHPSEKRKRLKKIFNSDYFESHIVVTDAISLEKLINTDLYVSSPQDGSGFIYIYTFEDNILAGLYEEGMLWWKTRRYEAKLKIGRTEQNVFRRIEQQLDCKTAISEPPILLAIFWTTRVVLCEHEIHRELADKRLTDKSGEPARGGVEWFRDTPTHILPVVLKWLEHFSHVSSPLASEIEI